MPRRSALVFAFFSATMFGLPQEDPGHRTYLWRAEGFAPTAEALAALRESGISGVDAEGPAGVASALELGLPFYVDHALPKGFLHIRRQDFHDARTAFLQHRDPSRRVRTPCLRDPAALTQARERLLETLAALGDASPDFLSLGDECSVTKGVSPFDSCMCPICLAELPRFLAARWGGRDAAKTAWGARWPDDGGPLPPTTDEARAAAFHKKGGPETIVAWSDFRAFTDAGFTGAVRSLAETARAERKDLRVGLLGCSSPSAFGGYDWERLAPWLDVVEAYDHGALRTLAGGLCGRRTRFVSTATPGDGDADLLRYRLWRRFLRGDQAVVLFWSKDWCVDGDPSRPSPLLRAIGPTLREFASDALSPWRQAIPAPPLAAIWCSSDAARANWLCATRDDGAAWINRLTSFENAQGIDARSRESWVALLEDLGFAPTFASTPRLDLDRAELAHAAILVLSRASAVSEIDREALRAFGSSRLVVADELAGLFTHRMEAWPKPAFDEDFGVARSGVGFDAAPSSRPAGPGSPPLAAADPTLRATTAYAERRESDGETFLKGKVGARRTIYMNCSVADYRDDRILRPERASALRDALTPHVAAVRRRTRPTIEGPADARALPVALHVRSRGDATVVAVEVNVLTNDAPPSREVMDRIRNAPPSRVVLRLPTLSSGTDLRTGKALGEGTEFEVETTFGRPRVLLFTNR